MRKNRPSQAYQTVLGIKLSLRIVCALGEQGYFVNFPSKFISADGRTLWLSYSGNFATTWDGQDIKKTPLPSSYAWCLQEVKQTAPEKVSVESSY